VIKIEIISEHKCAKCGYKEPVVLNIDLIDSDKAIKEFEDLIVKLIKSSRNVKYELAAWAIQCPHVKTEV
jgi:hypothetical protein